MHMGMYFILIFVHFIVLLHCLHHVSLFSINLRTEKGYFDGTFIMKDDDVSSFVGYVHEKTKHVITFNLFSYFIFQSNYHYWNINNNFNRMSCRPQVKGCVAPLNGEQPKSLLKSRHQKLMRKALRLLCADMEDF